MSDITQNARKTNRTDSRPKRTQVHYAAILLAILDFLANIAAVGGLITSHAGLIIITTAVFGIIGGLYLFLKQWGKPLGPHAALAVAFIVASSVMLTVHYARDAATTVSDTSDGGTATSDNHTGTAQSPSRTSGGSDGKPLDKNSNHKVVLDKDFTLTAQDGLELDDEKGTILAQQSAASAPVDLYASTYGLFYSTEDFYPYQATRNPTGNTDTDEYNSCKNLIATSQLGTRYLQYADLKPGQQYCIQTTHGRIAIVTSQEMIDGGSNTANTRAEFTVKLWD